MHSIIIISGTRIMFLPFYLCKYFLFILNINGYRMSLSSMKMFLILFYEKMFLIWIYTHDVDSITNLPIYIIKPMKQTNMKNVSYTFLIKMLSNLHNE